MRRLVSTHYTHLRKDIMIPEAEASNLSPCKTLAAIKALTYSHLRMLKISPGLRVAVHSSVGVKRQGGVKIYSQYLERTTCSHPIF